ncbi:protein kinase subdomain-containing protein pkl/ccin9 [Gigaspora margarita]|uniref:Protein kinase subdomain-containing protein pkl/ccin9 n=1 Tax=Gigaspora margarita TaxID=4874 RepID=A0A8H4A5N6_GIGMA|nr:protein kinase subdomain-containing protein pkl/ccin9 [Gigaspora margarita]
MRPCSLSLFRFTFFYHKYIQKYILPILVILYTTMQESFFLSFTWYTYAIMLPIIAFFGWLALPFSLFASIIALMLGTIYLMKAIRPCLRTINLDSEEPYLRSSNNPEESYLRSYAKRLDIDKIIKNEEDVEKFYKFTGPDFDWPPEFDIHARELVISYIIRPDHWFVEGEGEELATNTLAYHRLLKSNELDSSKGSHVLIMNGQIRRYGGKISEDEYDRLLEQHPGMFYAPVKERPPILIRRSSAIDDVGRKEWQVSVHAIYHEQ